MSTLSPAQIATLVRQAGFPEDKVARMTAIALAESSGNPRAHNPNANTGDNSYGLFQINMLGGMGPERRKQFGLSSNEELFDPATNAAAARKILESQGLNAWSVHRSGAADRFMEQARQAAGAPAAPLRMAGGSSTPAPAAAAEGFDPSRLMAQVFGTTSALGSRGQRPEAAPARTGGEMAQRILGTSFAGAAGFAPQGQVRMAGSRMPQIGAAAFGLDPEQVLQMVNSMPEFATPDFSSGSGPVRMAGGAGGPANKVAPLTRSIGGATTNWKRDPDAERSGYDIVKPGGVGAPIVTPVDLEITGKGFQGSGAGESGRGYGNWLSGRFQGADGRPYELLLGHLDGYDVEPGARVPAGTVLGRQGITGRAFGAHVTTHVNPLGHDGDAWGELDRLTRAWTASN